MAGRGEAAVEVPEATLESIRQMIRVTDSLAGNVRRVNEAIEGLLQNKQIVDNIAMTMGTPVGDIPEARRAQEGSATAAANDSMQPQPE